MADTETRWVREKDMSSADMLEIMRRVVMHGDEAGRNAVMTLTDDEVFQAARTVALDLVRNAVRDGYQVRRMFSLTAQDRKPGHAMRIAIELADGTTIVFPGGGKP